MMKNSVKKRIKDIVTRDTEENTIKIFYKNPITGETTLYGQYPNDKDISVTADSPETAETFLKLRKLK